MIDYRAGEWGLHVALGWQGSLAPRSLAMAIPNALITLILCYWIDYEKYEDTVTDAAQKVTLAFSTVMLFILQNRSRTSYSRWWEGGTLLQKARGEWFNAYSSIMAFTSTKPDLQDQVDEYVHFIARLMSLLMCCALQQVSPNRDRPFEIIGLEGVDPGSMDFLNTAPDKVEIILQWIQRSMVLHMQTGVLPVAPPILSRAFQEVSRGIVNLQNARKIADFPYPFPLAQVSMILQILHWATTPIASALALPTTWAVAFSFVSTFVLWCIHFNALDLEFPFGSRVNDLPMNEFQQDWNKSLCTLLHRRAQKPPAFDYDPDTHDQLPVAMSDASDLYVPTLSPASSRYTVSRITVKAGSTEEINKRSKRYSLVKDETPSKGASSGSFLGRRSTKSLDADVHRSVKSDAQDKTVSWQSSSRRESANNRGSRESANSDRGSRSQELTIIEESREEGEAAEVDRTSATQLTALTASPSARFQATSSQQSAKTQIIDLDGRQIGREALAKPIGIQPLHLDARAKASQEMEITI